MPISRKMTAARLYAGVLCGAHNAAREFDAESGAGFPQRYQLFKEGLVLIPTAVMLIIADNFIKTDLIHCDYAGGETER